MGGDELVQEEKVIALVFSMPDGLTELISKGWQESILVRKQ